MPHYDELSDGQGHWKTARDKLLTEIWKHIEFLKTGEDLVREQNQDNKSKARWMLRPLSIGLPVEAGMRYVGAAEFL
jgi:hypothetical protein